MSFTWVLLALAAMVAPMGSVGATRLDGGTGHGGLRWRPHRQLACRAAFCAAAVVSLLVGWLGGVALGVSLVLACVCVAQMLRRWSARRGRERDARAASDIVQLVRAEVEAGSAPGDAILASVEVGRFHAELQAMAAELRQARDPSPVAPPPLRPLAHALRVSSASGAALGAVLEMVGAQLQADRERSAAVAAALAGARSSAALLAVLPAVGLALGAALGANPLRVLLVTGAGHVLVLMGVVLECLGLAWTSRLAGTAERA